MAPIGALKSWLTWASSAALRRWSGRRSGGPVSGSSAMASAGSASQQSHDLVEQAGQIHGLRIVVVTAGLERLFAIVRHGVGGERDHRDGAGRGRRLDLARRLPAVDDRE